MASPAPESPPQPPLEPSRGPSPEPPVRAGPPRPIRHTSLASSASDWITARILEGRIKPGERVTEVGLAEQMGISRSPVREALRALSREGFITVEPRRGARVGELDRGHAEELYACRLLLEPECDAAAVAALTDERADRLEQAFARMRSAVADHDSTAYVTASKDYAWTLLDGCPNRTLFGFAESAWRSCLRYWDLMVRSTQDHAASSLRRNEPVHAAVLARDPGQVRRASTQVLGLAREELLGALDRLDAEEPAADPPSTSHG